ncbi:hypothetical protein AB870_04465 [Pandoraea faecigallinarum]|uniref:Uncharacterized protein n=1 Tax=Pandoraea faecigallinarum TaxID=656179 RepID=A0A0H3WPR8_9BURK|nr:hypothetical protein [Pandoraea faecigallinarum]AKM29550.1 hypothetical protein AB870_04465 [Pandoraea faecigallinarum]
MSVASATSSIGLIGHVSRSLSADTVEACTKQGIQYQLNTLWERIKDWILGTNKVAATSAIHTMATTASAGKQVDAFLELTQYVKPEHRHQLKWCTGEGAAPYFMIGDAVIQAAPDWAGRTPLNLNTVEMARMLISTHHNETPLLLKFLQIEAASAHEARPPMVSEDEDGTIYVDMESHSAFLRESASLVDALEFIGMHRNDNDFERSHALGLQVEAEWWAMGRQPVALATGGVTQDAETVGGMAQNVMIVTTDLFYERMDLTRRTMAGSVGGF